MPITLEILLEVQYTVMHNSKRWESLGHRCSKFVPAFHKENWTRSSQKAELKMYQTCKSCHMQGFCARIIWALSCFYFQGWIIWFCSWWRESGESFAEVIPNGGNAQKMEEIKPSRCHVFDCMIIDPTPENLICNCCTLLSRSYVQHNGNYRPEFLTSGIFCWNSPCLF